MYKFLKYLRILHFFLLELKKYTQNLKINFQQISWILEGQVSLQTIDDVTDLNLITLNEFNAATAMYNSLDLVELYQYYSDTIRRHYSFPQHCNGLIANVLIYQTNQNMLKDLAEPNRIKRIFNDAKSLIRLGQQSLDQVFIYE